MTPDTVYVYHKPAQGNSDSDQELMLNYNNNLSLGNPLAKEADCWEGPTILFLKLPGQQFVYNP